MEREHDIASRSAMKSKANIALVIFLMSAAFFLITEHRAHLSGGFSSYGIWLLLLACPLMHVFMHGGHGHEGHGSAEASH